MSINTIIFDLDGTLIDSAGSILYGFERVVKSAGLSFKKEIDKNLIGPPLDEVLRSLTGITDLSQLEELVRAFTAYYDDSGYKKMFAYAGVDDLLRNLRKKNFRLILATNKRVTPTLKIIDYLQWTSLFEVIYAIDLNIEKPFNNKKSMLADLIREKGINSKKAIYVGDRLDDQDAAKKNDLQSITVGWGYGEYSDDSVYSQLIHSPSDLIRLLENR